MFLHFYCFSVHPLTFSQSFFLWDAVLAMINKGWLSCGYRFLSWGVAAPATQVPFTCQSNPLGQGTPLPWDPSVLVWENNLDYSCGHDWAEQLSDLVFFYQTLWGWLATLLVPLVSWWEAMEKMLKTTASSTFTIYCHFCIGRWDKPHLISCGLLQHTPPGETAAEFIVTFFL